MSAPSGACCGMAPPNQGCVAAQLQPSYRESAGAGPQGSHPGKSGRATLWPHFWRLCRLLEISPDRKPEALPEAQARSPKRDAAHAGFSLHNLSAARQSINSMQQQPRQRIKMHGPARVQAPFLLLSLLLSPSALRVLAIAPVADRGAALLDATQLRPVGAPQGPAAMVLPPALPPPLVARAVAPALGLDPGSLRLMHDTTDELGLRHVRFQQVVLFPSGQQAPVRGGDVCVHLGRQGEVRGVAARYRTGACCRLAASASRAAAAFRLPAPQSCLHRCMRSLATLWTAHPPCGRPRWAAPRRPRPRAAQSATLLVR